MCTYNLNHTFLTDFKFMNHHRLTVHNMIITKISSLVCDDCRQGEWTQTSATHTIVSCSVYYRRMFLQCFSPWLLFSAFTFSSRILLSKMSSTVLLSTSPLYDYIDCKLSLQLVLFRLFHSARVFFKHAVKKLLRTEKYRTEAWKKNKSDIGFDRTVFRFYCRSAHSQPKFSTNIRIHHM